MSAKRALYDNPKDRISNLPRNLIDGILERMSTRNAARPSILSKKWRYIWSTHPQLVLDYDFFLGPDEKNVRWTASEYVKVINKILIVHNGTIEEFNLHIPFAQSPEMDLWILILSRNGIKDLTLHNTHSQPYKLPCYLFSCTELTSLDLYNFTIPVPPLDFRGFRNLNELFLVKISLSPKIRSHSRSCMELFVALCKEVEQQKDFDLMVLLSNITEIRRLRLDGFSLKVSTFTNEGMQQVLNYMEASGHFDMAVLDKLQTVKLKSCISKAALQFAKLLLSCSPSLEQMTIDNRSQSINANEQLRISTELMRFPRASTKAELIYLL
ncbi:hypothetical protein LguiA_030036 [Lonicera macranthoides]